MTKSDALNLALPGRLACISYYRPDLVQEGIKLMSGKYEHTICLMGGDKIMQAVIGGFLPGKLSDYLDGSCDLLILDIPHVSEIQREAICATWEKMEGEGYGYGADIGDGFLEILHKLHVAGALNLPNLLASDKEPNCSMGGALGLAHGAGFKFKERIEDIMPETLAEEPGLLHVSTIIGSELT